MEELKKLYKKFYKRLAFEGILNALISGFLIPLALSLPLSLIFYFLWIKLWWLPLTAAMILGTVLSAVLYFVRFRPDSRTVARRVDLTGLEERVITMVELQNDTSDMAALQRADAIRHLKKAKGIRLPLLLSKKQGIASVSMAAGLLLLTVLNAASAYGLIPSFGKNGQEELPDLAVVEYLESEGGSVLGEKRQTVYTGENANGVMAIPNDGFMFDIWSDGVKTAYRKDEQIKDSFHVEALFVPIGSGSDSGIKDPTVPDADFNPGAMDGDMPNISGGLGEYKENNNIIDGDTYYKDVYEEYYEKALKIIHEGGTLPEYLRTIVEKYYGIIR